MRITLVLLTMATVAHAADQRECTAERKRAVALRQVLASVGETTPEYRVMMLKRIQEAEASANNCERAVAEQKRTDEARLAAKKREDAAAAQRAAADRFAMDEMKSEASFIRVVWSAYACSFEKDRDEVLSNPFATPEQKEQLKRAEIMLVRIHGVMKRGKLLQLPCRADTVAKLSFCIGDKGSTPGCGQAEMALMIRAEKEVIASVQVAPSAAPLTPAEQQTRGDDEDMHILQPAF
jgi:hypothetical protein